jgi:hypothetical protein
LADRSVFERDLAALQAAANMDGDKLTRLGNSTTGEPNADARFLLGWVDEHNGNAAQARSDYRRYLDLAPAWSFLRRVALMRRHAEQFVSE